MERRGFLGRLAVGLGLPFVGLKVVESLPASAPSNSLLTSQWICREFSKILESELRSMRWTTTVGNRGYSDTQYHVGIADIPASMDPEIACSEYLFPSASLMAYQLVHDRIKVLSPMGPIRHGSAEAIQCKSDSVTVRMVRAYRIYHDDTLIRFDVRGRA